MRLTTSNAQFAVYDDVLSTDDFKALRGYLQVEEYHWVHAHKWEKVWHVLDGAPLMGPLVYSHAVVPDSIVYPSGCELDRLIEVLQQHQVAFEPLIGRHGEDWAALAARPYIYPQGAGLSWHVDEGRYTGSFIYYAHEHWNVQWGGELLVTDGSCRIRYPEIDPGDATGRRMLESLHQAQFMDNRYLSSRLLERGLGEYVLPRPNRLVILAGGHYHTIKRVEPAAGDHSRQSITGFFLRAAAVASDSQAAGQAGG